MSKKIFIYKENGTSDRDCVKYIETIEKKLECGHYFPKINLHGACFSMSLDLKEIDFSNITTILTKEEFKKLETYNKEMNDLGYGINKGDDRHKKGLKLIDSVQHIFDKLQSEENQELFYKVQQEEVKWLREEYNLNDEGIESIFDEYYLNYRDRGIISYVFDNSEEMAKEEAEALGYIQDGNDRYFNYETFADDLLESERYFELEDGRVVVLNY